MTTKIYIHKYFKVKNCMALLSWKCSTEAKLYTLWKSVKLLFLQNQHASDYIEQTNKSVMFLVVFIGEFAVCCT